MGAETLKLYVWIGKNTVRIHEQFHVMVFGVPRGNMSNLIFASPSPFQCQMGVHAILVPEKVFQKTLLIMNRRGSYNILSNHRLWVYQHTDAIAHHNRQVFIFDDQNHFKFSRWLFLDASKNIFLKNKCFSLLELNRFWKYLKT